MSKMLWSIKILVITTLALVMARTAADPDLWGHLRFGFDTLQTRAIAQTDPYSYLTTGQRWINHEWLAEVAFASAWKVGRGETGLIFLKLTIGLATVAILSRHLLSVTRNQIHGLIILLMGTLPLLPFLFYVRPQMFTFLFFALILLVIERAETGDYRKLWLAPPVMAFWANFHGGVLAGLGLLGLWAALHFLHHRQAWQQFLPQIVLSMLSILINPYGAGLPVFLLRTATVPRPEIIDWQPLKLVSALGFMYLLIFTVTMVGLALSPIKRSPVILILLAVTALLPWTAVRHLPLFSMAALIFAGKHIACSWEIKFPRRSTETLLAPWLAGVPILLAGFMLLAGLKLDLNHIHILENEVPPPAAATDLLIQSNVTGNLATEFGWGEYIIWRLGPKIKVSMDGRRETIYSQETYRQNLNFMFGTEDWDALLTNYPTDFALVLQNSAPCNLLRLRPGWLPIYEDTRSALFVRRDSPQAEKLRLAAKSYVAPPDDRYFP